MILHQYTRGLDQINAQRNLQINGGKTRGAVNDLSLLLGKWVNTDRNTPGIMRVVLSAENTHLKLQAYGAASSGVTDWGEVTALAFAGSVASGQAVGFKARYRFGSSDTLIAAYLNKRILVVDSYKDVCDGNAHSRCFLRDHFYMEGE